MTSLTNGSTKVLLGVAIALAGYFAGLFLSCDSCTAGVLAYTIKETRDDGTECIGKWYPDGVEAGLDFLGVTPPRIYSAALRFDVPGLSRGQTVSFARLRFTCPSEQISTPLRLVIHGIAEDGASLYSDARLPSAMPHTDASVVWHLAPSQRSEPLLFYRTTPNLAPIVNEILARPGWGAESKSILLLIEPDTTGQGMRGRFKFQDWSGKNRHRNPAALEIFTTDDDAFLGRVMLGAPTDRSVRLNALSLIPLDISLRYGPTAGESAAARPYGLGPLAVPAFEPTEEVLTDLERNTEYGYQMSWQPSGARKTNTETPRQFRTQRSPGSSFVFTIQADSHMGTTTISGLGRRARMYERTLRNVAEENPDFHIDVGDFSRIEVVARRSAATLDETRERYASQRHFLSELCQSVAFFLVLGNHEAEQGWRDPSRGDSLAIWGAIARTSMIPNPEPDGFYTGNTDNTLGFPIEDYYAWQWGDALFVVIDPFRYTVTRPHRVGGVTRTSLDGWDWTLGKEQYDWLYETLHGSRAKWKFVFAHHITGGVVEGRRSAGAYGRGGIDAAQYRVAHRPTFEWGGEDSTGKYIFDAMRPGWSHGPIHQMMAKEGVDIFFRGHDHVFVYEKLDGIVYQTCPTPSDRKYTHGFYDPGIFSTGIMVNNVGHLRVAVSADSVRVDYVRSVLREDEPVSEGEEEVRNGDVSYSYTLRK